MILYPLFLSSCLMQHQINHLYYKRKNSVHFIEERLKKKPKKNPALVSDYLQISPDWPLSKLTFPNCKHNPEAALTETLPLAAPSNITLPSAGQPVSPGLLVDLWSLLHVGGVCKQICHHLYVSFSLPPSV